MLDFINAIQSGSFGEISAQIIGLIALAASVISYQMKTYRRIMMMQMICAAFFMAHMGALFLLGHNEAISGCVGNAVCLIRDVVFLRMANKELQRPWILTLVFSLLLILVVALTWQSPISLICMIGFVFNTISFSAKEPQNVRKLILLASPFFLAYNFFSASIGGFCNEIISLISAIVGLLRFRKKSLKQ